MRWFVLLVHEFHGAYRRYHRWGRWVWYLILALVLAAYSVVLGLLLEPGAVVDRYLRPLVPEFVISLFVITVSLGMILPGMFFASWLFGHLARLDSRLICPHCGRGLALSFPRVLATRTCPRCDREILVDPFPAEPAPLNHAHH